MRGYLNREKKKINCIADNKNRTNPQAEAHGICRAVFGIEDCRTKVRGIKPAIPNKQGITRLEGSTGLGNIILVMLMLFSGLVFFFYFGSNRLFVCIALSVIFVCLLILLSAHFFFYKNQIFFEKWSDSIRYSRYPATMIIPNFTIVVFISWLKVATNVSVYLNLPVFLAINLPFLFSSLCYGLCAYYTLIGNLFDKNSRVLNKSGRLAVIYWKMGQIFLVSALVPMTAMVVFIAAFMI